MLETLQVWLVPLSCFVEILSKAFVSSCNTSTIERSRTTALFPPWTPPKQGILTGLTIWDQNLSLPPIAVLYEDVMWEEKQWRVLKHKHWLSLYPTTALYCAQQIQPGLSTLQTLQSSTIERFACERPPSVKLFSPTTYNTSVDARSRESQIDWNYPDPLIQRAFLVPTSASCKIANLFDSLLRLLLVAFCLFRSYLCLLSLCLELCKLPFYLLHPSTVATATDNRLRTLDFPLGSRRVPTLVN